MTNQHIYPAEVAGNSPQLISPRQACNRLLCLLAAWQRRSVERRRLLDATARELRDVGLSREQVLAAARKPFWQA